MNHWPKDIWIFSNMFYGESHMHGIIWSFSLEILICYLIKLLTCENHISERGKHYVQCLVMIEQAFQASHWMCRALCLPGAAHAVLGVVVCHRFPIYSFFFSFFSLSFQKMQVCHFFVCFFQFQSLFFWCLILPFNPFIKKLFFFNLILQL